MGLYFFDDENIIGYSWAIQEYLEEEIEIMIEFNSDDDDTDILLTKELVEELEKHDGLVECSYHPMGAYTVYDLIHA